jgi:hypothetical protein
MNNKRLLLLNEAAISRGNEDMQVITEQASSLNEGAKA